MGLGTAARFGRHQRMSMAVWKYCDYSYLQHGYEGIHIRKCDEFQISGNELIGEAYYGIRVSGGRNFRDLDMSSIHNHVEDNDLQGLVIKSPDDYSDNHSDGSMFIGSVGKSQTAHYWLNKYSSRNRIQSRDDEVVIDEGIDNEIIRK